MIARIPKINLPNHRSAAHNTPADRAGGSYLPDNRFDSVTQLKPGEWMTHGETVQRRVDESAAPSDFGEPVIQRFVYVKLKNDLVDAIEDAKRPPGPLSGGSQGDHTTPFTVIQNQIKNAVRAVSLETAWNNLEITYNIYQNLPGWEDTRKGDKEAYGELLDKAFEDKGDINALQAAIHNMLYLRNRIDLTSLPEGGYGNAEAKWAGGLDYLERQIQLGHEIKVKKKDVIINMCMAFEHRRVNKVNEEKRDQIYIQHSRTIVDAYWRVSKALEITADDVYNALPKYAKV